MWAIAWHRSDIEELGIPFPMTREIGLTGFEASVSNWNGMIATLL
jgi:hypothetical protein